MELVEMTIQTDADMATEEHTDLSEVTPGQRGTSERGQAEATTDEETPMDLGKTQCGHNVTQSLQSMAVMSFIGLIKECNLFMSKICYVS